MNKLFNTHDELKNYIEKEAERVAKSGLNSSQKLSEISILNGIYMGYCLAMNWARDKNMSSRTISKVNS